MSAQPPLALLVGAEARKLATRASARLAVVALIVVGLVVPLGLFLLTTFVKVSPEAASEGFVGFTFEATRSLGTTLWLRNFFLFRALIIAVVAVSFAGELVSRTLREDLLRPVSRARVLAAKWGALQVFVAVGAIVPFLVSLPLSMLLFGATGDFGTVLVGYGLTWLGDAAFATLVMAISLLVRSVPGTIGGVFLYWIFDRSLGFVLWAIEAGRFFLDDLFQRWRMPELQRAVDAVVAFRPWLPSTAFDLWWDYNPSSPFPWRSLVAVLLYGAASYLVALWWFRRIDVD